MTDSANLKDTPYIHAVYYDKLQNKFCFDYDAVSQLLLNDSIKDKNVVVVSVAGAYRKGKSFLLDFFIIYLKNLQRNNERFSSETFDDEDFEWMGTETLTGFPWRGGSERETNGILIWGEPFIITLSNGETVAVILMDTQGSFDDSSTVKDCATIFAMSTMLSSFQIYNISSNVQENDLDHLQLFTEYGRVASESSIYKPFQDLMLLVRDWSYPYEFEYGSNELFLQRKLEIHKDKPLEVQSVRKHIRDCFENVFMFLLPHPGLNVATSPIFKGKPMEIDPTFKKYLSRLSHFVLSPKRLKSKLSHGNLVTCKDLLTYFETYISIFQSDILPEPKSILAATSEANHLVALNCSKHIYDENMNKVCGGDTSYIPPDELLQVHNKNHELALLNFNSIKKMGNDEYSQTYKDLLIKYTQNKYEEYIKINSSKQVSSIKFIILAFVMCMSSFVISSILDIVGLDIFMLPFNIFSAISIIIIIFCVFAQFNGGYSYIIHPLEKFTDKLVVHFKDLAVQKYLETKGTIEHHKKS